MSLPWRTLCAFQSVAHARAFMVLLSSAALSSCGVLLGDNVKGSFVCSAPGGTCAPSTLIDDQALALIQSARPERLGSHSPVIVRRAEARAGAFPSARSSSASGRSAGAARVSDNLFHRDARTLRLVFPAYVDDAGNLHEARVVHTVVDRGGWIELTDGSLAPLAGTDPSQSEALPATPAPDPSETSISDQSLAAPTVGKSGGPASQQSTPPISPLTIDAIRDQVAERLSATAKPVQPKVQVQAAASPQGATPKSAAEHTSETASPRPATPRMPTVANPPATFSAPGED
jgi:conjugal transfer pilus assembly protein TraV